ncbi:MAG: hypothetical protein ACI39R_08545 [Lachnospiraceae bacterium]
MKKIRYLLFAMLLVLSMAIFTACGKVDEPTQAEVEEVLRDKGYLPDDEDKDDENADSDDTADEDLEKPVEEKAQWSVTIDECKINDDKDKAEVDCTLVIKEGAVQTTTEFEITFKIRDDKTWKCKKVEEGDTEVTLVEGIPDDTAEELLKNSGYSSDEEGFYIYSDYISSVEITKHENDLKNMQDTVTATITGQSGYKEYEFEVEAVFYYDRYDSWGQYWYISEKTVQPGVKSDYVESYMITISEDDMADFLVDDEYEYVYFAGDYYYYYECDISDINLGDYELDGSNWLTVPCTFTVEKGSVSLDIYAEVELYYNGSEWTLDYITNEEISSWNSDGVGTWKGTDEDKGEVTMEIGSDVDYEGYPSGTVTVVSPTNGTYSYKIYLYDYDEDESYMATSFVEWITMPKDDDYYAYSSYDGYLSGNKLTPSYSWDKYEFTKQ